jgi:ferritin
MQWFVQEQIEEETLAQNLIDKLKIAGGDRATDESLFTLDKTLQEHRMMFLWRRKQQEIILKIIGNQTV